MQVIEKAMCPKEVAPLLGISPRGVTGLMKSGDLEAFRIRGKLWRTTLSKVIAYQKREFERWRVVTRPAA